MSSGSAIFSSSQNICTSILSRDIVLFVLELKLGHFANIDKNQTLPLYCLSLCLYFSLSIFVFSVIVKSKLGAEEREREADRRAYLLELLIRTENKLAN